MFYFQIEWHWILSSIGNAPLSISSPFETFPCFDPLTLSAAPSRSPNSPAARHQWMDSWYGRGQFTLWHIVQWVMYVWWGLQVEAAAAWGTVSTPQPHRVWYTKCLTVGASKDSRAHSCLAPCHYESLGSGKPFNLCHVFVCQVEAVWEGVFFPKRKNHVCRWAERIWVLVYL